MSVRVFVKLLTCRNMLKMVFFFFMSVTAVAHTITLYNTNVSNSARRLVKVERATYKWMVLVFFLFFSPLTSRQIPSWPAFNLVHK